MSQEMISIIDIARELGKKKQSIFKVLRRLGVTPQKRRDSGSGNQLVAYISVEDSKLVTKAFLGRSERLSTISDGTQSNDEFISSEVGVFYLIQLEPEHDPGRFKVGFAASMPERLRTLRCSAPFATVVKTWQSRRLWEKTAIDCVAVGCEKLHTEVFRTTDLNGVIAKCQQFFDLMPLAIQTDDVDTTELEGEPIVTL